MNRWDELKATALDIADWVCADPADRNRMADDLLKLAGLMAQAVGKGVAIEGESAQNDALKYGEETPGEAAAAHSRYLVGERIQDAAREAVSEAQGADLDRYERSGLKPVWVPSTGSARRAAQSAATLSLKAWAAGDAVAASPIREGALDPVPLGNPQMVDLSGFHPPADAVRRSVHGSASAADVAAGRCHCITCRNNRVNSHTWVGALDGDNQPTGDVICGVCGADRCSCTTAPGMIEGPSQDCPSHGDHIARHCNPGRA